MLIGNFYVQCQQHHRRMTQDLESLCPECDGKIINAYQMPDGPMQGLD